VRVHGLDVLSVPLRLRDPVLSAGLVHADKSTLFFCVATDEGSGWGECCAYPGARFPDPTPSDLEPGVVDRLVGRLFAQCPSGELPPANQIATLCNAESVAEQAVAAALEMAVLDAELRDGSRSLASWVGVQPGRVATGALVGIPPGREVAPLVEGVAAAIEQGAARIRVKIEPGWERTPLEAVRARFPDATILADANGSFGRDDVGLLRTLDDLDLRCLEQPFSADDLAAHAALAEVVRTPIGLDESLWSLERVAEAVASGACRVACLKPGRLGGAIATLHAARVCAGAGVECFVGGFFESGLGRALNATIAARPEFGLPGDLGHPDRYLAANPFGYLPVEHGQVQLSSLPGIGTGLREDLLVGARRRSVYPA
jgi:o-succinylbenzoate synthase